MSTPSDVEHAIGDVVAGLPNDTFEEDELRTVVDDVLELQCADLPAKLGEYKGAAISGRLPSLVTELQLARSIGRLGAPVSFHVGDLGDHLKTGHSSTPGNRPL